MTGDADYLIRVAVLDMEALGRFLIEQLSPMKEVEKIASSFALKQVRYKTTLPLVAWVRARVLTGGGAGSKIPR